MASPMQPAGAAGQSVRRLGAHGAVVAGAVFLAGTELAAMHTTHDTPMLTTATPLIDSGTCTSGKTCHVRKLDRCR